jgi:FAD/FMN-containing dehydrogenase
MTEALIQANANREQLSQIVGPDNVCDDPAVLSGFGSDQSFVLPIKPWFVVRPGTVEQVQAIVKWANETSTALVPVSSGAPHFNGDTVPSIAGAVIVDLSRMKAVKRIDRRNRIVVIEPGVTYEELRPQLTAAGLRIASPLLVRPNKSVVASLLERQPTTIPRLNFSVPEPLRDCGVVWGTGELAFTGEAGSGPLSLEAQWQAGRGQVNQQGPLATDLMRLLTGAQGTMGIVVWASIKCELLPAARRSVAIPAATLEAIVDFCYWIERVRLGDEVVILNRRQFAAALGRCGGAVRESGLPEWVVLIGIAGAALYPQEKVDVQVHELQDAARRFGLELRESAETVLNSEILSVLESLSPTPYWKLASKGGCQDVFFLTTLDRIPRFMQLVEKVAGRLGYPAADIGVYVQPQHQGVSQHVEFSFPYNPANRSEVERARAIHEAVSRALIERNAYFSRPYGIWADLVYSRDATATRVLRVVKQIVDPKRILNPGKLCF